MERILNAIEIERERLLSVFSNVHDTSEWKIHIILSELDNNDNPIRTLLNSVSIGKGNACYGRDVKILYIPTDSWEIRQFRTQKFPPSDFDKNRVGEKNQWHLWRINVWHEFIHEIQDRILNIPPVDYPHERWNQAIDLFIESLKRKYPLDTNLQNVTFEILNEVLVNLNRRA